MEIQIEQVCKGSLHMLMTLDFTLHCNVPEGITNLGLSKQDLSQASFDFQPQNATNNILDLLSADTDQECQTASVHLWVDPNHHCIQMELLRVVGYWYSHEMQQIEFQEDL